MADADDGQDMLEALYRSYEEWLRGKSDKVKKEHGYYLADRAGDLPGNWDEAMKSAGFTDHGYHAESVCYDLYTSDGVDKLMAAVETAGLPRKCLHVSSGPDDSDSVRFCPITGIAICCWLTEYGASQEIQHFSTVRKRPRDGDSDWFCLCQAYQSCKPEHRERLLEILRRFDDRWANPRNPSTLPSRDHTHRLVAMPKKEDFQDGGVAWGCREWSGKIVTQSVEIEKITDKTIVLKERLPAFGNKKQFLLADGHAHPTAKAAMEAELSRLQASATELRQKLAKIEADAASLFSEISSSGSC